MDSLNERLNHLMHNEASHSKAFELLQESVTFLQSELHSKDEIIKTLLETQTAVLDTVSKKRTSNTMGNEENVIVRGRSRLHSLIQMLKSHLQW